MKGRRLVRGAVFFKWYVINLFNYGATQRILQYCTSTSCLDVVSDKAPWSWLRTHCMRWVLQSMELFGQCVTALFSLENVISVPVMSTVPNAFSLPLSIDAAWHVAPSLLLTGVYCSTCFRTEKGGDQGGLI